VKAKRKSKKKLVPRNPNWDQNLESLIILTNHYIACPFDDKVKSEIKRTLKQLDPEVALFVKEELRGRLSAFGRPPFEALED